MNDVSIPSLLAQVVDSCGGSRRPGQEDMAEAVATALEEEQHLLVQAGTGTGKSLGYLVPAMEWALRTGESVIISTATIALQRQIVSKDAPAVADVMEAALGRRPKVAVLKGWANYACIHKVEGGYPEEDALLSRAEGAYGATATGKEVVRVRQWARSSATGDRDELSPGVDGRVWAQVSISKPECLGDRCPLVKECFARQARLQAEDADIIVTNHAMLAVQTQGINVLPQAGAIIVDEGHELADRVTSQLTSTLSAGDIRSLARSLRRAKVPATRVEEAAEAFEGVLDELPEGRLIAVPDALFDTLLAVRGTAQEAAEDAAAMRAPSTEDAAEKKVIQARIAEVVSVVDEALSERVAAGSLVAWVSHSDNRRSYLSVAPLDVASSLEESLFAECPVVITSATLALGGSFSHLASRIGFSGDEGHGWHARTVASPFEPKRQAICYIARDVAVPGREGVSDDALNRLVELIEASGGGALGLFTSTRGAERACEYVRDRLDIEVLLQGEGYLPELIERFSAEDSTCLFGTRSLWQGVDVPGRTNRLVAIDRIPFPPPSDPLISARCEAADRAGSSGFRAVSLPAAALQLAQGTGRLLRTTEDRGVIAILDPRMATARYSSFLQASLADYFWTDSLSEVRGALERLAHESLEHTPSAQ